MKNQNIVFILTPLAIFAVVASCCNKIQLDAGQPPGRTYFITFEKHLVNRQNFKVALANAHSSWHRHLKLRPACSGDPLPDVGTPDNTSVPFPIVPQPGNAGALHVTQTIGHLNYREAKALADSLQAPDGKTCP